ncbi:hypothetical protein DPMN_077000 [Dreissena polymorpha]|uniref:Homeobox domain-containing protein n=1 Tax=Dreissena polymorpha TaxID=45954 RepID=A0A9D4BP70_DREPO|nr:hypothetical protein DPMN_077000 [Dreissena polymorpha]
MGTGKFDKGPYLSKNRRQQLSDELDLDADNSKVWFQNKRAKLKKDGPNDDADATDKEEDDDNDDNNQLR